RQGRRPYRPRVALWLVLLVLVAALANSWMYLAACSNALDSGILAGDAFEGRRLLERDGLLAWFASHRYYPPLYFGWLALLCPAGERPSVELLVMWSDLLVVAGLLGLACALLRMGGKAEAAATAALLAVGSPIINQQLKVLQFECGLLGVVGLALWLLSGPRGLPGLFGAALLGLLGGLGLLFKWTAGLYLLGPVAVATVTWFRSGGAVGAGAARLALAAVVAALIAGPWFAFVLDWDLLATTTLNDQTPGLPQGFAAFRVQLANYAGDLPSGLGLHLSGLVAAGVAVGLLRRARGTFLFLSSAVVAIVCLACFRHWESRYLAPLIPALAAAAGAGFSTLTRPVAVAVAVVAALLSAAQVDDSTWTNLRRGSPPVTIGLHGSMDGEKRMVWTSSAVNRLHDRYKMFLGALARPGEPLDWAVHPVESHSALAVHLCEFLARTDPAPVVSWHLRGYDAPGFASFAEQLESAPVAVLFLSENLLRIDRAEALQLVRHGATVVDQATGSRSGRVPSEDPLLLAKLRYAYWWVETVPDPEGALWVLLRKDLVERCTNLPRLGLCIRPVPLE
ncbi:MAG: hypothetical protein HY814_02695, partial [Candidatus Riflebacteria bacterium]|nr:hypothetical protein [Candidatus Riflebacteria bacterium]